MSRLGAEGDAVYRVLADALLPAVGAMPAASDVGVAGETLDRVLGWRPDLAPDLTRGVAKARGMAPDAALRSLEADDPEAFGAIRLAALGAYYLDPKVRDALGYPGQQSRPVPAGDTPDYLAPGLLEPVVARGPIWRRTGDAS